MSLSLKQGRLLRGFTQKEMADILGLCEDTYRKIERNPEIATIAQAKKISKKLDMNYDAIFFAANSSLARV